MNLMKKGVVGLLLVLAACSTDKTLSTEEQLAKDVATIDKYLADNNITNAIKDASGLRYVITTPAPAGAKIPTLANGISVKYVGKLMSTGVAFDSHPTTAVNFGTLAGLIKGWQIGFTQFGKGTVATLYIPSGLGYGTVGSPPAIPANANLIFDVTLVDVK
ncbi:MAG: FKBP-type peptidyl-prolyl cis-trans isomerase [Cyclobacteriaceae bacterium]|jgi:peptidylprolyl isomerase|nr:hypothetical protein [Cytophagales bacterium]HNP76683.1 FKBP-type peptidyl-prolyl cis-trans isomerase [Cyclobacteriaceae bacterium]HQQ81534.1 FKBP-type peptidyl-prolyl cis-trans isomerase [Cyclobacteriaceae bacterium]